MKIKSYLSEYLFQLLDGVEKLIPYETVCI
jgi:hypothetical protein